MTWAAMLDEWSLIEQDLADRGVDVGDPILMRSRSWRWLRTRILGLLDADLHYVPLADGSVSVIPGSRLGRHFHKN